MIESILNWIFPQRLGQSDKAHYEYLKEMYRLNNELINTYKEICAGHDTQLARCDWIVAGQEEIIKMQDDRIKTSDECTKVHRDYIEILEKQSKHYEELLMSAGIMKKF